MHNDRNMQRKVIGALSENAGIKILFLHFCFYLLPIDKLGFICYHITSDRKENI